jgi:hypothetical protein
MYELSKQIIAYFIAETSFTDVVSENIYAVIAPEEQEFPFVCFTINQQETATKDIDSFDVTLFLWFDQNQYDAAMQFTDTVTSLVKENNEWDWQNSTFLFVEENISYCGIINFNKIN